MVKVPQFQAVLTALAVGHRGIFQTARALVRANIQLSTLA